MNAIPLNRAIRSIFECFEYDATPFRPTRWQGRDVSDRPESEMREMMHVNLEAQMPELHLLQYMTQANQPWAENHFQERVCGYPINPGIEWANWPFGVNAEKSLDKNGMFNHNYMERYWPRLAGATQPTTTSEDYVMKAPIADSILPLRGIRHEYGDLAGLVRHLVNEPDTRQAYLPVWFPEDTGDSHNGRKPCTLGYHFIMRNGRLDVVYYLRSCDLANHFRDDVYLTVRLAQWILEQCRGSGNDEWRQVVPGKIVVQITNLHMFINDFRKIYG